MTENKQAPARSTQPLASQQSSSMQTSNGLPPGSTTIVGQVNGGSTPGIAKSDVGKSTQSVVSHPAQYKTVQILSQPNHPSSSSNCVLVQQVAKNNHSISFQQISTQDAHSQQSQQPVQGQFRQVNSNYVPRQQGQTQHIVSQPTHSVDGNHIVQAPARYAQIVGDDGRVQMIQVQNPQYFVSAPGQQQQGAILHYVQQQQPFIAGNSVFITSQDGSRTLQAMPAQIHTVQQHTVSPQNTSFQLTKASAKNAKIVQAAGQTSQPIIQLNANGASYAVTSGSSQPVVSEQQTYQTFEGTQMRAKGGSTPSKSKTKSHKTPPNTQTQHIVNHSGQPTATIQQITLPVNSQLRFPQQQVQVVPQRTTAAFVAAAPQTSQEPPPAAPIQHPQQIEISQPSQTVLVPVNSNMVVRPRKTATAKNRAAPPAPPEQEVVRLKQIPAPIISTPATTSMISNKTTPTSSSATLKTQRPESPNRSPVPNDPFSSKSKLNMNFQSEDPRESYRRLKKHFKHLVYENECYQGQLRDSWQKLLKLERDNNYLMDRLLKYENLSDSDGNESDSSVKTIQDKVVVVKAKKRAGTRNTNGPPKKKAMRATATAARASTAKSKTTKAATEDAKSSASSKAASATTTTESMPPPPTDSASTTVTAAPSIQTPMIATVSTAASSALNPMPTTASKQAPAPELAPIVYKPPPQSAPASSAPSVPPSAEVKYIPVSASAASSVNMAPTPSMAQAQLNGTDGACMPPPPLPPPKSEVTSEAQFSVPSGPVSSASPLKPGLKVTNGTKKAPPAKATVVISELPKSDGSKAKEVYRPKVPPLSTGANVGPNGAAAPSQKVYTIMHKPLPPRNPVPPHNPAYSTAKPAIASSQPMPANPVPRMSRPRVQIVSQTAQNVPAPAPIFLGGPRARVTVPPSSPLVRPSTPRKDSPVRKI